MANNSRNPEDPQSSTARSIHIYTNPKTNAWRGAVSTARLAAYSSRAIFYPPMSNPEFVEIEIPLTIKLRVIAGTPIPANVTATIDTPIPGAASVETTVKVPPAAAAPTPAVAAPAAPTPEPAAAAPAADDFMVTEATPAAPKITDAASVTQANFWAAPSGLAFKDANNNAIPSTTRLGTMDRPTLEKLAKNAPAAKAQIAKTGGPTAAISAAAIDQLCLWLAEANEKWPDKKDYVPAGAREVADAAEAY